MKHSIIYIFLGHQTKKKKYDTSNNSSSSTNIEELSKCHEQNAQLPVSDVSLCPSLGNNEPNDLVSNEIYDENDLNLGLPNGFVSEQHNDLSNELSKKIFFCIKSNKNTKYRIKKKQTSNIDEDVEDMELHETSK